MATASGGTPSRARRSAISARRSRKWRAYGWCPGRGAAARRGGAPPTKGEPGAGDVMRIAAASNPAATSGPTSKQQGPMPGPAQARRPVGEAAAEPVTAATMASSSPPTTLRQPQWPWARHEPAVMVTGTQSATVNQSTSSGSSVRSASAGPCRPGPVRAQYPGAVLEPQARDAVGEAERSEYDLLVFAHAAGASSVDRPTLSDANGWALTPPVRSETAARNRPRWPRWRADEADGPSIEGDHGWSVGRRRRAVQSARSRPGADAADQRRPARALGRRLGVGAELPARCRACGSRSWPGRSCGRGAGPGCGRFSSPAVAVGIADLLAAGLLKPWIDRLRPCFLLSDVRLLVPRPVPQPLLSLEPCRELLRRGGSAGFARSRGSRGPPSSWRRWWPSPGSIWVCTTRSTSWAGRYLAWVWGGGSGRSRPGRGPSRFSLERKLPKIKA